MTYDPNIRTTEREVIEVPPRGPSYGGALLAVILAVVVILGAVWLFSNDDTSGPATPTETTIETTVPVETTAPTETSPSTTTAP